MKRVPGNLKEGFQVGGEYDTVKTKQLTEGQRRTTMMGDDKQYRGSLHQIQAICRSLLYQIQATQCQWSWCKLVSEANLNKQTTFFSSHKRDIAHHPLNTFFAHRHRHKFKFLVFEATSSIACIWYGNFYTVPRLLVFDTVTSIFLCLPAALSIRASKPFFRLSSFFLSSWRPKESFDVCLTTTTSCLLLVFDAATT